MLSSQPVNSIDDNGIRGPRAWLAIVALACLTACGGSGGGGAASVPAPPDPPAPTAAQSPGGVWFGFDEAAEQVVFYISETGEFRLVMHPDGGPFPSFGGGNVAVSSDDVVSGSFELRGPLSENFQRGEDLGCSVSGSVRERQSLAVDVVCSDSGGVVYDQALTLIYEGNSYERASSLDAFAGDYTLEFRPETNALNVAGDGALFGRYHNGANCTVNGIASIIDPEYSLISVRWTMSDCTDPFGEYEGVEMSGFAQASPAPTDTAGRYYFLLTGRTPNGLYSISVIYEPV